MRPSILLTNDDGVSSIGLWAAYEALKPIADVTVVAPATQQSAVGRSISIFEPLRATEVVMNGEESLGCCRETYRCGDHRALLPDAETHDRSERDKYW